MVSAAEKAFKLQKDQWLKLAKDSGISAGVSKKDLEEIFLAAKAPLPSQAALNKKKKSKAKDRGKNKAGQGDESEDLPLDGFVYTLLRFALIKFEETRKEADESITVLSTLDRLKQLFETCLVPYLAETDYEDSAVEGRDSQEVEISMPKNVVLSILCHRFRSCSRHTMRN